MGLFKLSLKELKETKVKAYELLHFYIRIQSLTFSKHHVQLRQQLDDQHFQASNESNKFTTIFEMNNKSQEAKVYRPSSNDLSSPLGQIARYVAATGQILNIGDVATWSKKDVVQCGDESIKSILCMPIANGQRTVIGVAQLINKVTLYLSIKFKFNNRITRY